MTGKLQIHAILVFWLFFSKNLCFWLTQGSQTLTYVSNINWLSGKYKFWSLSTESQKSNIAMVKVLIDHGFFRALGLQYAKISCYHTDRLLDFVLEVGPFCVVCVVWKKKSYFNNIFLGMASLTPPFFRLKMSCTLFPTGNLV